MLDELTERDGIVLATGGGAVLEEGNRTKLRSRGFAIYLNAPLNLLVERTSRDRHRPLLDTDDPQARFEELMAERDPLYRQVADLIITTDHRTTKFVVREILKRLSTL